MSHDDLPYWAALASEPSIGARSFTKLLARFTSMKEVWHADKTKLAQAGLPPSLIANVLRARAFFDPDRVVSLLRRHDIAVLTLLDKSYPPLLREIADPPGVLFIKGTLADDDLLLAVVGSRKYTHYGARVVETLVPSLVDSNLTIVSGLALGIDSLAHEQTLRSGGRTIAVLAGGLDVIYPSSHHRLAERILESGGLLLSEFPPGTRSYPSNFPVRNRIIAGLSLGTLVIEAATDSGSLLTAKAALDYNREVFAVPGDIFRATSQGVNNLLKMGAKLVTSADDILQELSITKRQVTRHSRRIIPDSPEEAAILALLSAEPTHINRVAQTSKMGVERVGSLLVMMEMKGKVKNVGGNHYVKV